MVVFELHNAKNYCLGSGVAAQTFKINKKDDYEKTGKEKEIGK